MSVVVRAKLDNVNQKYAGYYGHKRRKPGDQFELDDPSHFSLKWMDLVSGELPTEIEQKRQALNPQPVKKAVVKKPAKVETVEDEVI